MIVILGQVRKGGGGEGRGREQERATRGPFQFLTDIHTDVMDMPANLGYLTASSLLFVS